MCFNSLFASTSITFKRGKGAKEYRVFTVLLHLLPALYWLISSILEMIPAPECKAKFPHKCGDNCFAFIHDKKRNYEYAEYVKRIAKPDACDIYFVIGV